MSAAPKFSEEACAEALKKISVPPAAALARYMSLLLDWNEKINVTGASTPEEFALKHVADVWCALEALGRPTKEVFDVGSGGGVPGLVLSIISPATKVTLVERRQKKVLVLSDLVEKLGLSKRVQIASTTFEQIPRPEEGVEFWFRGFLPGPKLAAYFSEFFPRADLGPIVLMKGPAWTEEKLQIMSEQKVKEAWKERFADAAEVDYDLPLGAGKRTLVLV